MYPICRPPHPFLLEQGVGARGHLAAEDEGGVGVGVAREDGLQGGQLPGERLLHELPLLLLHLPVLAWEEQEEEEGTYSR